MVLGMTLASHRIDRLEMIRSRTAVLDAQGVVWCGRMRPFTY